MKPPPIDMAVHANDADRDGGGRAITIIALSAIAVLVIGAGLVLWSLAR